MIVALDIGGSRIKIAWRSARGPSRPFAAVPTALVAAPDGFAVRLRDALPAAVRAAVAAGTVARVAVGVAGQVRDPGVVVYSPNLPRWRRVRVAQPLRQALRAPVLVENDANMAALGWRARAGQAATANTFVLTLGTGIGGAWLTDGRLYRQPQGGEGEVGHCEVIPGGRVCSCGRRGCLEAYAGTAGLLAAYRDGGGTPVDDARALSERAGAGDAAARAAFAAAGDALGRACAWLSNLLCVDDFVFAGGVAAARRHLLTPLREAFAAHRFGRGHARPHFRFPARAARLGVEGALYAATVGAANYRHRHA